MKEFINTFSIQILLTKEEYVALFEKENTLFRYNRNDEIWVIKDCDKCGLWVNAQHLENDSPLRKLVKWHPEYELIFIVNPEKLLDPNRNLAGLTGKEDIASACKKLNGIINNIEKISGVDLLQRADLYQVCLAKDIVTPNDFYTCEIIEAALNAVDCRVYTEHNPLELCYVKYSTGEVDSIVFYGLTESVKIYDKKCDLLVNKCDSEVEKIGNYGLLSFEISLSHDLLNDKYCPKGYTIPDTLPEILYRITVEGYTLLRNYFDCLFYEGTMLSRSVLKKYLYRKCAKCKKRNSKECKKCEKHQRMKNAESMIGFSDWLNKMGTENLELYDTFDGICSQIADFEKLKISPVQVNKRCPYIPSFLDMINDTVDNNLFSFALLATAHKCDELTYWNFD